MPCSISCSIAAVFLIGMIYFNNATVNSKVVKHYKESLPPNLKVLYDKIAKERLSNVSVQLSLVAGPNMADITESCLRHPKGLRLPLCETGDPNIAECKVDNLAIPVASIHHGKTFRLVAKLYEGNTMLLSCESHKFYTCPPPKDQNQPLTPDMAVTSLKNIGASYARILQDKFGITTIGQFAKLSPDRAACEDLCRVLRRRRGFLKPEDLVCSISQAIDVARLSPPMD